MAIDEVRNQAWSRKHDNPDVPVVPRAPLTVYPKSLEELIAICSNRNPKERIHAAGSHWALSTATISDFTFVETHDPANVHQAMGRTLYDVVPGCLNPRFIAALASQIVPPFDSATNAENAGLYPVHIETGKRVYQLYAELDSGDDDPKSLATLLASQKNNPSYLGPWAFQTLGGAGGQTVFGALTTGTHGGDFHLPPIADAVMAIHLVVDGGKHYWIEPESLTKFHETLTDDNLLRALYGQARYGRPNNFEIIRDDDMFNSVLVSAGRFGIVYSIVLAAVRQYCMHQERRLMMWQDIKSAINNTSSTLYHHAQPSNAPSKFLQIAISVTPCENFSKNLAGVTKRWNVPLAEVPPPAPPGTPAGRPERRGAKGPFDSLIQAPRFEFAGNSFPYSPDPARPGMALPPNFLERACSNGDFLVGVIESTITEVKNFVESHGAVIGAGIAAVTAAGGGGTLLALASSLLAILALLLVFLEALRALGDKRFGQVMDDVRKLLLNQADPGMREAGLFVWQVISFKAFSSQQENNDFDAISYAVMDGHDYFERSCTANGDSIEVFFDATDPMLIAYVDALLAFEAWQEVTAGRAFVGYISLRFTGATRAVIGPQRYPLTCAVEVSGLRDVDGVTQLLDYAIQLALNRNFKGILHWGQRNESKRIDVEERFGDTRTDHTGKLRRWRNALSKITQNGKLDGFSSEFTRRTGLEIVTPLIGRWNSSGSSHLAPITITWDCEQNPPATAISLEILYPSGHTSRLASLPHVGQRQVPVGERGVYVVALAAAIDVGGEWRETRETANVVIA